MKPRGLAMVGAMILSLSGVPEVMADDVGDGAVATSKASSSVRELMARLYETDAKCDEQASKELLKEVYPLVAGHQAFIFGRKTRDNLKDKCPDKAKNISALLKSNQPEMWYLLSFEKLYVSQPSPELIFGEIKRVIDLIEAKLEEANDKGLSYKEQRLYMKQYSDSL
ncbi:MAG: hypothetical protein Q8P68_01350 [Candidatus Peregrinibacteria bacterium]|nr:hypothetical protein [Candidatus Peregrinibacteria bacterium]MDZ4245347.1 hypothetical protein [Candidatus Gracilibacteria bacterium]